VKSVVLHLRGKRIEIKVGDNREPDWPFDLTPEERKLGVDGLWAKHAGFLAQFGDPTAPGWQIEPFKKYDDVSLEQLFRGFGLSPEAIALMAGTVGVGYGWSTGSALNRCLSDFFLFQAGRREIQVVEGGFDLLPRAFAHELRERIVYGAPVARIVQEPDRVRVVYRRTGGEETLAADHLVCTAPCPVLRRIEFTPELPARKRQILAQLEYTPVTRIYVQARRRIWAEAGVRGSSNTDLPIGLVTEHPLSRPPGLGPRGVLEAHIRGPEAAKVAALDPAARLAFAADNLDKVHPGFKAVAEGGASVSWGDDPWAGGGYAWWKPGQLTTWMPELARAEGRLHFAGEHTSALSRTMEGALESGNRAAREIDALGKV
jgi:monoamine oxidase